MTGGSIYRVSVTSFHNESSEMAARFEIGVEMSPSIYNFCKLNFLKL